MIPKNFEPKRTIRITVPISVAYDLEAFQKSMASLAELLGCGDCFSGANCLFTLEKQFLVDPESRVQRSVALPQDPVPDRSAKLGDDVGGRVVAKLDVNASRSITVLQRSVASIAERLGCDGCTSGFDLLFLRDVKLLKDESFKVNAAGEIS